MEAGEDPGRREPGPSPHSLHPGSPRPFEELGQRKSSHSGRLERQTWLFLANARACLTNQNQPFVEGEGQ